MKVLLAVSGGIDSMTMADIMFSHSRLYGTLAIAHCNFHLRPGDCDADEALVRDWALARGIRFHRKDFDTAGYASEKGVSVEMAARELRYAWFSELCRVHGYDALAVAHNANDNAETLMLNLLRGTGLRGITGMAQSGEGGPDGTIPLVLRPLLGMTRKEIEAYARQHSVPFRTDRTNLENEYRRNGIRNLVFPLFEEINPSFVRTLNRNMEHFREADAIVREWCSEARKRVMEGEVISLPALLGERHWKYLLYSILEQYGFQPPVISCVQRLVESPGHTFAGKTFSGDGYRLVTARERLVLVPENDSWELSADKLYIEAYPYERGMDLRRPAGTIIFDSDRLPDDAVLRCWIAGDWFIPLGMRGKKKLSDFFKDLHLTPVEKERVIVLAPADSDDRHIYAVIGYRIDERIKVTPKTSEVTSITVRP